MNFLTHILISGALYRKLSKKMALDRMSFYYGNIKPDLSPECLRNPHILENYLFTVHNDTNRLIHRNEQEEFSVKEFSADLGVICHYISDFFCCCHLNKEIYHKLFRHFIYEIKLHLTFCCLLAGNRFKVKKYRAYHSASIASVILELRNKYHTKQKTPKRDLDYAIMASLWACERIYRLSIQKSVPAVQEATPAAPYASTILK